MKVNKSIYRKIKPSVKLTLGGDEKLFGKGVVQLLFLIDKYGTIQKAAASMEMSYSKSWKIIHRLEQVLGIKIVETKAGGEKGGKTSLTHIARDLLVRFDKMNKDLKQYSSKAYNKYFLSE